MIHMHSSKTSALAHRRRGSILVIALMVVVGVAGLGACLLQFSVSMTRNQVQGIDKKRAFYLAEAGLSEGIYGLLAGGSGNVGSSSEPARFGDGVLWVEAVETADGRVRLECNALCGGGRASLAIVVEETTVSTAALGIFSDGDLVVKRGSVIDSYNSSAPAPEGEGGLLGGLGGEGGSESTSAGRVGSNGNIEVQGTLRTLTRIQGDVTPGPDGTVTSGTGVTITGSTAPRSAPIVLPAIEVPALPSLGDLMHESSTPLTIPAGEHRYDSLTLAKHTQITIVGPQTLVVGSLILEMDSDLVLDTSAGKVEIYATDYVSFEKDTQVDNTQHDPARAHLLISASESVDRNDDGVPDPPVSISSQGEMYATIYAPSAELTLNNSLEFYGAITAASLGLSESAQLHFDEALLEDDGSDSLTISLLSWRPLELPDVPLVNLRVDPVAALRLQGAALSAPYDSHQTVNFKVQYTDVSGELLAWAGDETQFDWTQVQTVTRTTRVGDADFTGGLLGSDGGIVDSLLGGALGF